MTVSGTSNNATLCNLHPGWAYRIELSGSTSKGMGPAYHADVYAGKECVILIHYFSVYKMLCKKKKNQRPHHAFLRISTTFRNIPAR